VEVALPFWLWFSPSKQSSKSVSNCVCFSPCRDVQPSPNHWDAPIKFYDNNFLSEISIQSVCGTFKKVRESQIDVTWDTFLRPNLIMNHDFMSLPFQTHTTPGQHKIIYCSARCLRAHAGKQRAPWTAFLWVTLLVVFWKYDVWPWGWKVQSPSPAHRPATTGALEQRCPWTLSQGEEDHHPIRRWSTVHTQVRHGLDPTVTL
jgi:hypothetical protein